MTSRSSGERVLGGAVSRAHRGCGRSYHLGRSQHPVDVENEAFDLEAMIERHGQLLNGSLHESILRRALFFVELLGFVKNYHLANFDNQG